VDVSGFYLKRVESLDKEWRVESLDNENVEFCRNTVQTFCSHKKGGVYSTRNMSSSGLYIIGTDINNDEVS
jgi:hypothetical protein